VTARKMKYSVMSAGAAEVGCSIIAPPAHVCPSAPHQA
jgi:hypothetical protein